MADAPAPYRQVVIGIPTRVGSWLRSLFGGFFGIVAVVLVLALLVSVMALAVAVPTGALVRNTANDFGNVPPLPDEIRNPAERSTVYAADGKTVLKHLVLDENRKLVALEDVPERVRNAVIAIEDDRFYEHEGVDFRGIARAAIADLRSGSIEQGGSTLTQQYVKKVITGDAQTLQRKVTEAIYAVELEKRMTKDEILEAYLNEAYFGEGVYGIATAAQHYFGGKSLADLSLAEAAALAGTIAAPERYKPSEKANKARRNLVLDRMAELGYAKAGEVAKAKKAELKIEIFEPRNRQPFFATYVKELLLNDPAYNKALGEPGSKQRIRKVYQGGLKIYTTLDLERQRQADKAVKDQVGHFQDQPIGALASVDPRSGEIVAMALSKEFEKNQVNPVTGAGSSGLQPGSSFKIFYVIAALQQGLPTGLTMRSPNHITIDQEPCLNGDGTPWEVDNAGDSEAGTFHMYDALIHSVNTYFAQLAPKVGPPNALEVARKMGIGVPKPGTEKYNKTWNVCSSVLGSVPVTPLEMASAFGVLANEGVRCEPYAIRKVVDRKDKVIVDNTRRKCKRVLEAGIANQVVDMMRGVVTEGTGFRARLDRPVAGKTGTAQNYVSAFFSGFTPQLSTSVWVGYRKELVPMDTLYQGGPVYGGTYPALIFQQYMQAALDGEPVLDFPAPPHRGPVGFPGDKNRDGIPDPPPKKEDKKDEEEEEPEAGVVPGVVGLPAAEAIRVLQDAGYETSTQLEPAPNPRDAGRVTRQSPGGGAELPEGETVTIVVGMRR